MATNIIIMGIMFTLAEHWNYLVVSLVIRAVEFRVNILNDIIILINMVTNKVVNIAMAKPFEEASLMEHNLKNAWLLIKVVSTCYNLMTIQEAL